MIGEGLSTRVAKVVLAASAMLLVGVGVSASHNESDVSRADLRGQEVRVPTNLAGAFALRSMRSGESPTLPKPIGSARPAHTATPTTTTIAYVAAPEPALPLRIAIPSLNLDANVVPVGVNDNGAMEIPGAIEAGWYRYGPRPGSAHGSAVIAGHVDHRKTPGVFLELRRLEIGQEVVVTDADAVSHRYLVTERFQVQKESLPVRTLFQRDGDPVLTLITCGGRFDRAARSYDDNIVIRATPISERWQ